MRAGDVLAFHSLTLHGTYPGDGEPPLGHHVRWSLDMRYSDAENGLQWAAEGYGQRFPPLRVSLAAAGSTGPGGSGGDGRRRIMDATRSTSWEQWKAAWADVHRRSSVARL